MTANDQNDEIIDTVTSLPIQSVGELTGPIRLLAEHPIASVEWWPSNSSAGIRIDNLCLVVPEPDSGVMLDWIMTVVEIDRRRSACRVGGLDDPIKLL